MLITDFPEVYKPTHHLAQGTRNIETNQAGSGEAGTRCKEYEDKRENGENHLSPLFICVFSFLESSLASLALEELTTQKDWGRADTVPCVMLHATKPDHLSSCVLSPEPTE